MAEIVHEAGELYAQDVALVYLKIGLLLLEVARHLAAEVGDADGVLLARVRRGRVDVEAPAELTDAVEPLELGRVHHGDEQAVERDHAVHSVLDRLGMLEPRSDVVLLAVGHWRVVASHVVRLRQAHHIVLGDVIVLVGVLVRWRTGAVLGIGLLVLRGSRARRMLKPPALGGWSAVDVHCVSNKCCVPLRRGVADE